METGTNHHLPWMHKIIMILVLFLCGSVLFLNLDSLSLRMWDESRNAINALEMLQSKNFLVVSYEGRSDLWNTKPPMMIWAITACMKVFGINEFAIRLPSVLAALTAMAVAFWIVYRGAGNNLLALVAPLALTTFPGFIDYHVARNGDFDAMLALWVFLAGMAFFRWLHDESGRTKFLWWMMVFFAGGIMTKGIAALIAVPGMVLYAVLAGKALKVFGNPRIYLAAILALLPVVVFYGLREMREPGYLRSVLENELTGRYLNVSEEHAADFRFYFRSLVDSRLGFWKFILPVSWMSLFFTKRSHFAFRVTSFSLITAVSFLLIISTSKTKLPWYDAPAFPFLAVSAAGGLAAWWNFLQARFRKQEHVPHALVAFLVCAGIAAYPFYRIHAKTSVRATMEQTYPELYYGNMIRDFFRSHPNDALKVVYDGYNSHALFYVRAFAAKGKRISACESNADFTTGDILLFCENPSYEQVNSRYRLEPFFSNETRILATVSYSRIDLLAANLQQAEERVKSKMNEIIATPDWSKSIQEKATANRIEFIKQVQLDAIYVLQVDKQITQTEADLLKNRNLK